MDWNTHHNEVPVGAFSEERDSPSRKRPYDDDSRNSYRPQHSRRPRYSGEYDNSRRVPKRIPLEELAKWDKALTLKEFLDYQNPSIGEHEAIDLYSNYKNLFKKNQLFNFYSQHKGEAWFMERYHPKQCENYQMNCRKALESRLLEFNQNLQEGKFLNLNLSENEKNEDDKGELEMTLDEQKLESENEEGKEGKLSTVSEISVDAASGMTKSSTHILLIKTIPPNISNQQVIDMFQICPGFKYVSFGLPELAKKSHRVAWVVFSEDVDMTAVYQKMENTKIGDFYFHFIIHKPSAMRIRSSGEPSESEERIRIDLKNARELVKALDSAKSVEHGYSGKLDVDSAVSSIEQVKKELDLTITYLRLVHLYCYYCSVEAENNELMIKNCGNIHLRRIKNGSIVKSSWVQSLDEKTANRIQKCKEGYDKTMERSLATEMTQDILKLEEEKYKCGLCTKLFKGNNFVEKHITLKHPERIEYYETEAAYFNNFIKDPISIAIPEMKFSSAIVFNPRFEQRNMQPKHTRQPPKDFIPDSRTVRSYVDLDAPAAGDVSISYD